MTTTTALRRLLGDPWHRYRRWMYRGGRPNRWARPQNRLTTMLIDSGLLRSTNLVTLEVRGRRTGRTVSFPLVVADHAGRRYLVAMLGENTNWVRNVRAAGGRAVLRQRRPESVRLLDVDVADRPPILRHYLAVAPGARPHIPVDRRAPLAEFERIAADFPVFQVVGAQGHADRRLWTT